VNTRKMSRYFDLTYLTIDSISEGVGSSQILPLIQRLSRAGLSIKLVSFEKQAADESTQHLLKEHGVEWRAIPFGFHGSLGGAERFMKIRSELSSTGLIHARSDIPAAAASFNNQAPILWDVRSLWADQKRIIQKSNFGPIFYPIYRGLESIAAHQSSGMSTLTKAVVPVLENRHRKLPFHKIVVPTAVDLSRFKLDPKMPKKPKGLFSGTYNEYYDLDISSQLLYELKKQTGIDADWARPHESQKQALGIGEQKIFEMSQQQMADVISQYSFGFSICKELAGSSLSAAMPTKIAEFLACGRPVIVNKGLGDMDEFIKEYRAGVIVDLDKMTIAETAVELLNLLADPETPLRCRALAERHFDLEVGVSKYLDLYTRLV
jgi:hypothetical protein